MSHYLADNRLCYNWIMSKIGYARVSTRDQNLDAQLDALREDGCERIFTDKLSGSLSSRPQLDTCLAYLRRGDVLVITKLDRLSRSVKDLIEMAGVLAERGIDLRVLSQGIDTSTPGGKLTFHILGAIAEFERDIIRERTRDGLAAARARGRVGGRRPVMTPDKLATAKQLYGGGKHTVGQIADILGVSRSTVHRALAADAEQTEATAAV